MARATVPPSAVMGQLDRMLQSDVFRGSGRSSKLLRFVVEQTINGHSDRLKDYTLGAEALGRGDDFDPRTDPIARVEASRLRSRLELYYATEGASEPILITLPKGGYVPLFEIRPTVEKQLAPASASNQRMWATAAVVGLVAIAGGIVYWSSRPRGPELAEMRLEITTPPTTDPVSLALAPDGQQIVFVVSSGGPARLWLRPLNATSARPLAGTEHAALPFWSPDGESVGFFADSAVKRIDIRTGVVQVLAEASVPAGGTWSRQGVIVYATNVDSPLVSVSSTGSVLGPRTLLAPGQTGHRGPQFLPDGRHFIYYAMGSPEVRGVYVGDMGRTIARRLFDADTPAVYVANHLLYVRQGMLLAQGFNPLKLELSGDPRPVAEHVTAGTRANTAAVSASASGLVAYRTGPSGGNRQFVWFDRSGREVARLGDPHGFGPSYASVSPDDRRLAVQRTEAGNTDIWLLDLDRPTPNRLTSGAEADIAPFWSPNGDRIVFSSRRSGHFNLFETPVAITAPKELLATDQTKSVTDWSRDGRFLLFRSFDPEYGWDIWAMPMTGDRKPFAVVRTKFEERDAQFSPDGEWIAYQSNDSGRFEIYVQPFQRAGERRRISPDGGVQPAWSRQGTELFYLALDGRLVAVPVVFSASTGQALKSGTPATLFQPRLSGVEDIALRQYVASSDAARFLVDTVVEETPSPITVILNWKPPEN